MSKSVDTRRMYYFEDKQLPLYVPRAAERCSIKVLRRLAQRIWRENSNYKHKCPAVVAVRGWLYQGVLSSYCEGRSKIGLIRQHRTRAVVIHEMTHALLNNMGEHGKAFQNRCFDLYMRYL